MADKPDLSNIPIPAFIKSMIEAHRRVDSRAEPLKTKTVIEGTYLPEWTRPKDVDLKAIGRVATSFSILERVLGMALARLAMAPEYTALSVTKDLSLDNQLKALKTLVDLHEQRYASELMNRKMIDGLRDIAAQIAMIKDERNIVVHTVWVKSVSGDGVSALPSKPSTAAKAAATKPVERTTANINDLANRIQAVADNLFVLVQLLPSVDEGQQVESLAQEANRLHSEIREAHRAQREEPGAKE